MNPNEVRPVLLFPKEQNQSGTPGFYDASLNSVAPIKDGGNAES